MAAEKADTAANEQRPTQKTIARITGLAVATVSRALADAPDIGAATKRRVREVAQEIGYRPDRAGVRLRTGKTNVISLVLSADRDMTNHTGWLISSIAGALRNTPYHLNVTPYFTSEDPMDPVRYIVETRSADAVILNQTTPQDPRVAYLMQHNFPFATHGRTDWCDDHPYFDFDNQAFAAHAVTELVTRGRKNILLVLPPLAQNYARNLKKGACTTAQKSGTSVAILNGATSDDPWSVVQAAVAADLSADPSIDAIICSSTNSAMAAATAAEIAGKTLGADLDLAAKETIPVLKQFRSPIITHHEDVTKAGVFLAQAAIQRIAKPNAPPMQALDVMDETDNLSDR